MNNYYDLETRIFEIKAEAEKTAAAAWKYKSAALRKERVIDRIARIALGLIKRKTAQAKTERGEHTMCVKEINNLNRKNACL